MNSFEYAGFQIELDRDGFLTDPGQWNVKIAQELSHEENIALTEKHFAVLNHLRFTNSKGEKISIRTIKNSGIVDLKSFYHLFNPNPLKRACRIAGLPKPEGCV